MLEEPVIMAPRKRRSITPAIPSPENGERRIHEVVDVPDLKFETVHIPIVGKTPLIVHNWSEKAIRMMLDKQLGKASKGREKKNPFEDFKGSLYPVMVDGKQRYGLPAPAFKACAVSGANAVELKMTQMKQAFHVNTYTIPINAPPLVRTPENVANKIWTEYDDEFVTELKSYHALGIGMRRDIVRLQTGVADIRFRGWFPTWEAELEVEYNPALISLAQLMNLFRSGGYGVGVGEWRPGAPECRSGEYGRFDVKSLMSRQSS